MESTQNYRNLEPIIAHLSQVQDTGRLVKNFIDALREIQRLQAAIIEHRKQKHGSPPVVTDGYDQELYDKLFPPVPTTFLTAAYDR